MIGRGALAYVRHTVLASFWFIPALLVVASVGLSALTLYLDIGPFGRAIGSGSWLAIAGVQSARAILSTIATSMITVVSLVFSLMLLALTLASQQLGPRMIIHFMEDRLNQIVLGAFTATFAYAVIVLRSIEDTGSSKFVPNLSINVALLLALICLGLLIYFIHHAAMLIQSDDVVASLAGALERDVRSLFPPPTSESRDDDDERSRLLGDDSCPIACAADGYVELISGSELLQIAIDNDLKIVLNYRAGHFVVARSEIARAAPADRIDDSIVNRIRGAVILGAKRTAAQDIQFSVRAIVDVVVRALSPSLNDFHTAMAGIDRLAGAVGTVMTRNMPEYILRDGDGVIRVALDPLSFESVMYTAFQQVHESARGHFAVCSHMLVALTDLARVARTEEQRRVIAAHGDIVANSLQDAPASPYERDRADEHLKRLRQALTEVSSP